MAYFPSPQRHLPVHQALFNSRGLIHPSRRNKC
jgi:hypothetical protein